WLSMMHFHIGSQVTSLSSFSKALDEAGRFYADLHHLGVRISTLDVGGGLAVDYEGNGSDNFCSMSYSIESYAQTIIASVKRICQQHRLPEPDIITESGRFMTAHHSVLMTNVVDIETIADRNVDHLPDHSDCSGLEQQADQILDSMSQLRQDYIAGQYELRELADAESHCIAQLKTIRDQLSALNLSSATEHSLAAECLLNEKLADKVFCNFSLFQSMPDVWAFQQRFPIMPLSRLDEMPDRHGVIQDLTCDSDGCISHYVEQHGVESSLRLHKIDKNEPYYLGFFLLGAYQEILGDMHNLFGDVDTINISIDASGHCHFYLPDKGDTVADLLRYVHFEPDQILEQLQRKLDNADLAQESKQMIEQLFRSTLDSGTYLEQI
ncbi:MAG: biosynthetic arginine decarboxylase, partial [Gammaproteobacteria bacterium]|nr:biosynthetic arginine decarboxylase [Gammaproteobacteria bacterium]